MFNKSKTNPINPPSDEPIKNPVEVDEMASENPNPVATPAPVPAPSAAPSPRNSMMDMITTTASKPSILSEGFSFRGEIAAKGAIHVEGALNGQIQVDELTIGSRGQVEGVVTCSSLHIKGKFSGTATCNELIVTSSASVDGHVVYQTLSVQKGASIKGELLLVK
jgi:cytoskeletal protein CcmA (bactofilin family)